jgi:Na+/glutamate symporter
VAGTAVPFTGGHGTVLPIATTAVKAGLVTNIALAIVGNNLQVLAMVAQRRGYANLKSSVPASLLAMELFAGEVRDWTYGNSIGANPLAAATVASIDVSNGDDAGASNLAMGVLVNA